MKRVITVHTHTHAHTHTFIPFLSVTEAADLLIAGKWRLEGVTVQEQLCVQVLEAQLGAALDRHPVEGGSRGRRGRRGGGRSITNQR